MLLHSDPVYGRTDFLLKNILPQFGVTPIGFPAEGGATALAEAAERARARGPVAGIYVETPANPTNGLVDMTAVRLAADAIGETARRPVIIVDNTMLGPLFQTPLALGADLVVTSLTKYVGGHSDLIAGCCSGSREHLDPIRGMRTILGRCATRKPAGC